MISKKLLLASSIALTFSSGISHSSIEMQAEQAWLKPQINADKPNNQRVAYYVKYAKGKKQNTVNSAKSIGAIIDYEFDRLDTLAISLPANAKKALAKIEHVIFKEPVPEYQIQAQVVPWNIDQFQARDVWDKNRDGVIDAGAPTGNGVKFCIIDTGFYAAHDDFQGIVHTGISQIPGEAYTEDGNGHGSHVAGTANAVNNNIGVVGVMPGGAEFFIVKIFDNTGTWSTGNSNLGSAITSCKDNGANAISMSLGGGFSATEEAMFQDLYDNFNIVSIAAAGNAGDATSSYPASYDSVISVAALRESDNVADFSQYPATAYNPNIPPANVEWDVVELSGGGENILSTWPGPPAGPDGNVPVYRVTNNGTGYDAIQIAETALGDVTQSLVDGGDCNTAATGGSDNPANWNGNIVLCQRNTISFADKMNNTADNGGLAMILYNNVAGSLSATCGGACTSGATIPGVSITETEGLFLQTNGLGLSTRVIADDGSGCVGCTGGYNTISGTSMATPGVAAGVAWAWSACGGPSGITNKQLRQLLRDSARDLSGTHDASGEVYGTGWDTHTGFGLVQLKDALDLGNQRFGSTCPIGLSVSPTSLNVCTIVPANNADFTVTLDANFTGTSNMTFSGNPTASSGSYSINPVIFPVDTSVFSVSNLDGVSFGTSTITLTATDANSPSNTQSTDVILNTYSSLPSSLVPTSPANGASNTALMTSFAWNVSTQADSYTIEIATDMLFSNIVVTASDLTTNSHTLTTSLASNTQYYWRVIATNPCGNQISSVYSFTTSNEVCTIYSSTNVPQAIAASPAPGDVLSTLTIADSGLITDIDVVNVAGTHSWINDISLSLLGPPPASTEITLMPRICNNENNWNINFDDEATTATLPCPPVGGGNYQPSVALSAFDNSDLNGIWTFIANDAVNQDGGSIDSWGVRICYLPTDTNNAPLAVADSYSINEDTILNVAASGVLGNDTDADGDALTAVLDTTTSNGALTLNANGSFDYVPTANYCDDSTPDTFTYHANDGTADSNTVSVTITVNCVNDPAIAVDDTPATIGQDSGANSIDVLANDTDVEGDIFLVTTTTDGSNGLVAITNAGTDLSYTPNANFCGADSFTYTITGGSTATVIMDVTCVNNAPTADNDNYNSSEDTILTITAPGVLIGDTDTDGDSLTAVLDSQTANGTVTLNADGSFSYTPDGNYCNNGGSPDTFTYHASDGLADSNIATVSITVSCVIDTYTVSVDVNNLLGTGFELQLNATETLPVTSNGTSSFSTVLNENDAYSVTVTSHPFDQFCTISNSSGTSNVDVTLTVSCGPNGIFRDGFEN